MLIICDDCGLERYKDEVEVIGYDEEYNFPIYKCFWCLGYYDTSYLEDDYDLDY